MVVAVSYVRAFHMVAIPQSDLLAQVRLFWLRVNYLFIFPSCYVALCVSEARHRPDRESVSWCLETPLLKIPFPGQASLPGTELPTHLLVSFSSFIFFPTCF